MNEKRNTQKQLQTLKEKIDVLEKTVDQLLKKAIDNKMSVEKLNVEKLELQNLVFRLDSISVKELSGSLNLGNNFGASFKEKSDSNLKLKPSNQSRSQRTPSSENKSNSESSSHLKNKPNQDRRQSQVEKNLKSDEPVRTEAKTAAIEIENNEIEEPTLKRTETGLTFTFNY